MIDLQRTVLRDSGMAKGFERHQERLAAVNRLGKDLARRCKSTCELCGNSGVGLSVYEVPPIPEDPVLENCLFICEDCGGQLANPKKIQAESWRCLATTIWSESPAAQVMSVRILDFLSKRESWAAEILADANLGEEIEEWAKKERL